MSLVSRWAQAACDGREKAGASRYPGSQNRDPGQPASFADYWWKTWLFGMKISIYRVLAGWRWCSSCFVRY
jgi:hypothetical protein